MAMRNVPETGLALLVIRRWQNHVEALLLLFARSRTTCSALDCWTNFIQKVQGQVKATSAHLFPFLSTFFGAVGHVADFHIMSILKYVLFRCRMS